MSIRRKKGVGIFTLLAAGVVAMGSYAFTASNTLPAGNSVGAGVSPTTGFTVTQVNWTANATNLSKVTYADFLLNTAADVVKVQLTTSSGAPSGTVYICDTSVGVGTGAGLGNHDYTLDDSTAAGTTHTVTATTTHPVCDLGAAGGGVDNSGITQLTVYTEKRA